MTTIKATITFDTTEKHPDEKNAKNLSFTDTYTFNDDMYGNDREFMTEYIKRDLSLVAGGGYNSKNIKNVTFKFN